MGVEGVLDVTDQQILGSVMIAVGVISGIFHFFNSASPENRMVKKVGLWKSRFGVPSLPGGAFVLGSAVWVLILIVLTSGLIWLLWTLIVFETPNIATAEESQFRFRLAQIAGLTAVLGAVIGLPITMSRLRLQGETLFNEKINAATEGLYAQRQRTIPRRDDSDPHEAYDVWEDDIVRRNAAIDRLTGLVEENPDVAERVSRLLSVYVRELSRKDQYPAVEAPEETKIYSDEFRNWRDQRNQRSDMENAVQKLGVMRSFAGVRASAVKIDLRGANLQAMDFAAGNFENAKMQDSHIQGANLYGAQMEGANLRRAQMEGAVLREAQMEGAVLFRAQMEGADLSGAQMEGAILRKAQMEGAVLVWAQMEGADLSEAQMQGADLSGAEMEGANLSGAEMDENTVFKPATLRGAGLKIVDDTTIAKVEPFWNDIFADGTVQIDRPRPAHWADDELNYLDFENRWRAWMRSIGMDPDDPK